MPNLIFIIAMSAVFGIGLAGYVAGVMLCHRGKPEALKRPNGMTTCGVVLMIFAALSIVIVFLPSIAIAFGQFLDRAAQPGWRDRAGASTLFAPFALATVGLVILISGVTDRPRTPRRVKVAAGVALFVIACALLVWLLISRT